MAFVKSFLIVAKLGGGRMGVVYETLLRSSSPKTWQDTQSLECFRAKPAASVLNHPNICTVYEIGEREGQSFIAMWRQSRFLAKKRRQFLKFQRRNGGILGKHTGGQHHNCRYRGTLHLNFIQDGTLLRQCGSLQIGHFPAGEIVIH